MDAKVPRQPRRMVKDYTMQKNTQLHLQKVTQHTNDIWNRVLFSLELMEYALGEKDYPKHFPIDKILLDLPDGKLRNEAVARFENTDLAEKDSFIQLQVRAFRRGLKNSESDASSEMPWLLTDFLEWYAGRIDSTWSKVDEYSLAIIKALLVKEYPDVSKAMPEMMDDDDTEEHDINETVQTWGASAHLVDSREKFVEEKSAETDGDLVEKLTHTRGSSSDGFYSICRLWASKDSTISLPDAQVAAFEVIQELGKTELQAT